MGHESAYHVRLTPAQGKANDLDQVAEFFKSVRAFFRDWRENHGLGAGWWVAECKVREMGHSMIRCPHRTWPEDIADWPEELQLAVKHRTIDCEAGKCYLCRGTGKLRDVHLHVHAVLYAKPFWFGQGEAPPPPEGKPSWEDFHGQGFPGLVKKHGLGNSQPEVIRSANGCATYITKSALTYISKVQGDVDWNVSQLDAELAAAVYQGQIHRGKIGRAYGVSLSERDASKVYEWVAKASATGDGAALPDALLAHRGQLTGARKAEKARKKFERIAHALAVDSGAQQEPVPGQALTIGRRVARTGAYGDEAIRLAPYSTKEIEAAARRLCATEGSQEYAAACAQQRTRREKLVRLRMAIRDTDRFTRYYAWRRFQVSPGVDRPLTVDDLRRRGAQLAQDLLEARQKWAARGVKLEARHEVQAEELDKRGRFPDSGARKALPLLSNEIASLEECESVPKLVGDFEIFPVGATIKHPGHSVPKDTQVAQARSGSPPGGESVPNQTATAFGQTATAFAGREPVRCPRTLAPLQVATSGPWKGVALVGEHQWWTQQTERGCILGRGQTFICLSSLTQYDAALAMEHAKAHRDYQRWYLKRNDKLEPLTGRQRAPWTVEVWRLWGDGPHAIAEE